MGDRENALKRREVAEKRLKRRFSRKQRLLDWLKRTYEPAMHPSTQDELLEHQAGWTAERLMAATERELAPWKLWS